MKKTLVALAAVSAVSAFAQTNFQPSGAVPNPAFKGFVVTGGFDASYANLKYKGGNSVSAITYNSTSTSQITMIGIEDLGGGLKADFNYESDINPTTMYNTGVAGLNGTAQSSTAGAANFSGAQAASTWGNGQVKVGIQTSMGYLGLGAINNGGLDWNQYSGPFGTAWGSGYGVTQATVGYGWGSAAKVRYDNSLRYLTPTMNGLTASLTYRAKNSQAANNQFSSTTGLQALSGVQELALIYNQGPINAIVVNQIDDGSGIAGATSAANTAAQTYVSGKKFTSNMIGGNYTLGAATLYYGNQKQSDDAAVQASTKTNRFAIKYALSPVLNVMASSNKMTYAKTGSSIDGLSTTVVGLGADYFLSKMTAVTFRYDKTQDDSMIGLSSNQALGSTGVMGAGFPGTATASDNTRTRTAVGLRVNF